MAVIEFITVEWLDKNCAGQGCIDGFKRDFGKKAKTRDVVAALNEKNYPDDCAYYMHWLWREFCCFPVVCNDCPYYPRAPSGCYNSSDKERDQINAELEKKGW